MGQDILVFHDLPTLWYRYPIPNELREFWYKFKPEILESKTNATLYVQARSTERFLLATE